MTKQEATIEFLKLKMQDFEKQLASIGKLNQEKIVSRDIKSLQEDITITLKALEQ